MINYIKCSIFSKVLSSSKVLKRNKLFRRFQMYNFAMRWNRLGSLFKQTFVKPAGLPFTKMLYKPVTRQHDMLQILKKYKKVQRYALDDKWWRLMQWKNEQYTQVKPDFQESHSTLLSIEPWNNGRYTICVTNLWGPTCPVIIKLNCRSGYMITYNQTTAVWKARHIILTAQLSSYVHWMQLMTDNVLYMQNQILFT